MDSYATFLPMPPNPGFAFFNNEGYQGGYLEDLRYDPQSVDLLLREACVEGVVCGVAAPLEEALMDGLLGFNNPVLSSQPISSCPTIVPEAAEIKSEGEEQPVLQKSSRKSKKALMAHTGKEPLAKNFSSPEDFQGAWTRWRQLRDSNNAAVRRSRENKKRKNTDCDHEDGGCESCEALSAQLDGLRNRTMMLLKALRHPNALTAEEREAVGSMLVCPA